jgi:glycosyltransferase involved in cell wall biosynthesis
LNKLQSDSACPVKQNIKPRLLILTSSFPGGPYDETCGYVRQLACRLASVFEVTVLAPADRQAEVVSDEPYKLMRSSSLLPDRLNPFQSTSDLNHLREASLPVKLAAAIALFGFFASALRLARQTEVICSHWLLPSGLIGALLSAGLRKPHIAVEHSGALHLLMNRRGGRWISRFIIARSRRVIVVSQDLRRKLIALCPDARGKSRVIPMGVDVGHELYDRHDLHRQNEQNEPFILFIGRLMKIKGVDLLLEAMREISGARLIIAGDGPERKSLEALAAGLMVDAEFLGQVDAASRNALFAACAVVVIPSRSLAGRTEGLPVVCLEAMAAGCAVIAARAGGLAEIVRDQHNGLLFEPDDAGMLAEKLRMLLNDAARRARLGQNARRTATDYDWTQVAASYARLIKDSLDDHAIDQDTSAKPERAAC